MKTKRAAILVFVTAFLVIIAVLLCVPALLFMRGTLVFNGVNASIPLPSVETITRIEITDRGNENVVAVENIDDINYILSALSETRVPIITTEFFWYRAASESPGAVNYLFISIFDEEKSIFGVYLYTTSNRGYVYWPYYGEYRIDPSIVRELRQNYME